MKKVLAGLLAISSIAAVSIAQGAPIHATFSGSVTGWNGLNNAVLSSFPVGTSASFDVTFDDSGLLPTSPLSDYDLAPVSGTVRLGSDLWSLSGGEVESYSYQNAAPNEIISYGLHLTGTGPTNSGGGSFYGLFLRLTPDLTPFNSTSLSVGFGYPTAGGVFYSYATLGGEYTGSRATTSVPEPATALLMLPAVLFLRRSRRKPI